MNKKQLLRQFLEFRKQFTKREWFEITQAIFAREQAKADQIQLDDFDLEVIQESVSRYL